MTFQTIWPGWYSGRALHYHFRIRLPGETTYAATSQMFISDADLALYQGLSPYSDTISRITSLTADNINRRLGSDVGDALTLNLVGSVDSGFTASLNVGLSTGATSTNGNNDADDEDTSENDTEVATPGTPPSQDVPDNARPVNHPGRPNASRRNATVTDDVLLASLLEESSTS